MQNRKARSVLMPTGEWMQFPIRRRAGAGSAALRTLATTATLAGMLIFGMCEADTNALRWTAWAISGVCGVVFYLLSKGAMENDHDPR